MIIMIVVALLTLVAYLSIATVVFIPALRRRYDQLPIEKSKMMKRERTSYPSLTKDLLEEGSISSQWEAFRNNGSFGYDVVVVENLHQSKIVNLVFSSLGWPVYLPMHLVNRGWTALIHLGESPIAGMKEAGEAKFEQSIKEEKFRKQCEAEIQSIINRDPQLTHSYKLTKEVSV